MPHSTTIHVDKLLSNVSVKYTNETYFADKIFPIVPVKKSTDLYRIYTRDWRIPNTLRAVRGVSNEADFQVTYSSYALEWHSQKGYVADRDVENYDVGDFKVDMTEHLTDIIYRKREQMVAALFATASWSLQVSLAATGVWSLNGTTASNPIPNFDTGAASILQNAGIKPNFIWMRHDGFIACKNHTSVLDRTKYTSAEMTENMLAALFGVKELHVVTPSYDQSQEGRTDSITSIWPNGAFIGYKPANPGPLQPSCGYIFENTGRPITKTWRDEERESDVIEVNREFVPKVVASLAGYYISGPV